MSTTDRIEKSTLLRASQGRVWRAITHAEEFGTWFRVKLAGPFVPGREVHGKLTYPGFEHLAFALVVDKMDAEVLFSYRWHPYAIDPKVDYSTEPMTLVEFRLAPVAEGVQLTITESGFDRLPPGRRDEAFRMNSGGWAKQLQNIEQHVAP
ncbi:vanillate O-demethylase oxidoreductase VanB [Corallococcus sp. H22C18031201]|nr:vanillate O-demethylase oxidoreductase VanB [Corallococcus sp. H22C18031201]